MKLSGSIKLKGPESKIQELEEAVDFSLTVEVQDEDKISIMTEVADLKTFENNDSFCFSMLTPERGSIGIILNYAQARAIKELLENQINARELFEKLLTPVIVKTA